VEQGIPLAERVHFSGNRLRREVILRVRVRKILHETWQTAWGYFRLGGGALGPAGLRPGGTAEAAVST